MLNIGLIEVICECCFDILVDVELLDKLAEYNELFCLVGWARWAIARSSSHREKAVEEVDLHREVRKWVVCSCIVAWS